MLLKHALSRKFPGKSIKVDVYRILSKDFGEAWCLELVKNKEVVHQEFFYQGTLDMRTHFNRSFWDETDFVVFQDLNIREVKRFQAANWL